MYPENPGGTQVIVGSMNMGYISDTVRNQTHNLFRPKRPTVTDTDIVLDPVEYSPQFRIRSTLKQWSYTWSSHNPSTMNCWNS